MPARALGSATISFGLVSIPVKLYSATQASAGIAFRLLHRKCGSRVKEQFLCPKDNEVVPRDEMVKGYEFSKDQYVTFTPEELKALEEKPSHAIEISEFIPLGEIDPLYFDKAYFLAPDKGGAKAYSLLFTTMERTKRVALARYAARGKQYLVMLRPSRGALILQQLLYANEVRSPSEIPMEPVEVREPEVKLATQLVEQIAAEHFHPEGYEDEVKKRLAEAVERKVAGREISLAPPPPEGGRIIDLMEALKASLGQKDVVVKSEEPKVEKRSEANGKLRRRNVKTARARK